MIVTTGRKPLDLTGDTYGKLTVLREELPKKTPYRKWETICECGKTAIVIQHNLRSGGTKSCGCLIGLPNITHGASNTRLFKIWSGMRERCNDVNSPHYIRYGQCGITICKEWEQFINFQHWANNNGYVKNLSIDRKNGNKGYSPINCRWVTHITQGRNRKKFKNTSSKYIGVSKVGDKWRSAINVNKKKHNIGSFATEHEAALARDKYISDNNLSDFTLNF